MKIALAIESSNTRGMGHLYRALLYIKKFKKDKVEYICLINDDPESISVLKCNEIKYLVVDYNDLDSGWEKEIINKYKIDIWINDKFETKLKMGKNIKESNVFFVMMDDIGEADIYADLFFSGTVSFSRKTFNCKKIYNGPEYIIINEEIEKYARIRDSIGRIIVTLGGSDPFNVTVEVVRVLMKLHYPFDVHVGPNCKCFDKLRELSDGRFLIFRKVSSTIELFRKYDFAITGGGITPFEMVSLGIPTMIIANAAHEENTGMYLHEMGCSIYLGSYSDWDYRKLNHIESLDIKKMSEIGIKSFNINAWEKIYTIIMKGYLRYKDNVL